MTNRLAAATSPYLLQHATNPVDWHEWSDEPFAIAKQRDVPLVLSVGYSACHWCHVMAHESFEDDATAQYMNRNFVNIKVDREERPDIDRIYMDAVQALTGRGGWPMTVFLTPTGEPFFAGTYFPKEPTGHLPTFMNLLAGVSQAWKRNRSDIHEQASRLTAVIRSGLPLKSKTVDEQAIADAIDTIKQQYDPVDGGFGSAPKFPQVPVLELLLRTAATWPNESVGGDARAMLVHTLDRMLAGGIYDHIYGGFARYSVDAHWAVPHFEKMLCDNALLATTYISAWQLTCTSSYRDVACQVLDYLLRDMQDAAGGIHAAEDADSEGSEGKFAVWSYEEFASTVGSDLAPMAAIYGVTHAGNFGGSTNLTRAFSLESIAAEFDLTVEQLTEIKTRGDKALRAKRARRTRPFVDDKIVASWNGMVVEALALAGAVFGEERYVEAAVRVADFVTGPNMTHDGRLMRSWRDGRVSGPGFCEDYGAVAIGLYRLYAATGDERWYLEADRLATELIRLFHDPDDGGFFAVGNDAPELITRPKNLLDNSTPADNSLAVQALLMQAAHTGNGAGLDAANRAQEVAGGLAARHPMSVAYLLATCAAAPNRQLAIATNGIAAATALLDTFYRRYRPAFILAIGDGQHVPLLEGRPSLHGLPTAYLCESFSCLPPMTEPAQLATHLDGAT